MHLFVCFKLRGLMLLGIVTKKAPMSTSGEEYHEVDYCLRIKGMKAKPQEAKQCGFCEIRALQWQISKFYLAQVRNRAHAH